MSLNKKSIVNNENTITWKNPFIHDEYDEHSIGFYTKKNLVKINMRKRQDEYNRMRNLMKIINDKLFDKSDSYIHSIKFTEGGFDLFLYNNLSSKYHRIIHFDFYDVELPDKDINSENGWFQLSESKNNENVEEIYEYKLPAKTRKNRLTNKVNSFKREDPIPYIQHRIDNERSDGEKATALDPWEFEYKSFIVSNNSSTPKSTIIEESHEEIRKY